VPTPELVQHSEDNVFKRIDVNKGDPDSVFRDAPHVVEGEYWTGSQEHVYLECQGMIAYVDPDNGRMTVKDSMQFPFYVIKALTHMFDREKNDFRVIQIPTGGGFGGKEDYPSVIVIHTLLLSLKAGGRPAKIFYDRLGGMAATTKRHPCITRHRTAVDKTGKILAMDIEVIMDGGSYVTLSPVVLSRRATVSPGPAAR